MLTRRSVLVGSLALAVSGCGFKLKGFYEIPAALQQVVVAEKSSSPTALGRELISQLKTNGVIVSSAAPYRIELATSSYNRRAISLDARASAKEYELSGQAKFAIYQQDAKTPLLERRVSALRTYSDDSNTNALETLENRYRNEINQSLAEQIIRQYLSIAPSSQ